MFEIRAMYKHLRHVIRHMENNDRRTWIHGAHAEPRVEIAVELQELIS